eukprot:IDg23293t1
MNSNLSDATAYTPKAIPQPTEGDKFISPTGGMSSKCNRTCPPAPHNPVIRPSSMDDLLPHFVLPPSRYKPPN